MRLAVISGDCPCCGNAVALAGMISSLPPIVIDERQRKEMRRIGDDMAEDLDALASFQADERERGKLNRRLNQGKAKR